MSSITEHQPSRQPLPDSWIRKLFAEMHGNYGAAWGKMWATGERLPDGSDAGMKVAMSVWQRSWRALLTSRKLSGLS